MVYQIHRFGRLKDPNDLRDFSVLTDTSKISKDDASLLQKMKKVIGPTGETINELPSKVNLSEYCTDVKDQGMIGACVGYATAAMDEFFKMKKYRQRKNGSGLFIYKIGRMKEGWEGDTGLYCRTGLGALRTHGIVPQIFYDKDIDVYNPDNGMWDKEPNAVSVGWAQNYQVLKYIRLDPNGFTGDQVVNSLRKSVGNGFGFLFGFNCYETLMHSSTGNTGDVPFPINSEQLIGGHAVFACGYDDTHEIVNPYDSQSKTTGAFLFKNSWSTDWGYQGYGMIPYEYFRTKLADDCYTITRAEWLDETDFSY